MTFTVDKLFLQLFQDILEPRKGVSIFVKKIIIIVINNIHIYYSKVNKKVLVIKYVRNLNKYDSLSEPLQALLIDLTIE